jgi:hypothetical protein
VDDLEHASPRLGPVPAVEGRLGAAEHIADAAEWAAATEFGNQKTETIST